MSAPFQWLNVIAAPGEVMDEVASAPPAWANIVIPTLLVCLCTVFCFPDPSEVPVERLTELLSVVSASLIGYAWAAFVLWALARFALKSPILFFKALEVIALTGLIVSLSVVISRLLGILMDKGTLSVSLAAFLNEGKGRGIGFSFLNAFHLFNLWSIWLIASGLSCLTRASRAECCFWVGLFWLVMPIFFH